MAPRGGKQQKGPPAKRSREDVLETSSSSEEESEECLVQQEGPSQKYARAKRAGANREPSPRRLKEPKERPAHREGSSQNGTGPSHDDTRTKRVRQNRSETSSASVGESERRLAQQAGLSPNGSPTRRVLRNLPEEPEERQAQLDEHVVAGPSQKRVKRVHADRRETSPRKVKEPKEQAGPSHEVARVKRVRAKLRETSPRKVKKHKEQAGLSQRQSSHVLESTRQASNYDEELTKLKAKLEADKEAKIEEFTKESDALDQWFIGHPAERPQVVHLKNLDRVKLDFLLATGTQQVTSEHERNVAKLDLDFKKLNQEQFDAKLKSIATELEKAELKCQVDRDKAVLEQTAERDGKVLELGYAKKREALNHTRQTNAIPDEDYRAALALLNAKEEDEKRKIIPRLEEEALNQKVKLEDEALNQKWATKQEELDRKCQQDKKKQKSKLIRGLITRPQYEEERRDIKTYQEEETLGIASGKLRDEVNRACAQKKERLLWQSRHGYITAMEYNKAFADAVDARDRGEKRSEDISNANTFLKNLRGKASLVGVDQLCLPAGVFVGGDSSLQHLEGQLFIRKSYKDLCDRIFQMALLGVPPEPGVYPDKKFLLLGNPGIGKTMFSYYLLYRLMQEKKTIVWQPLGDFQRILIPSAGAIQFGNTGDFAKQLNDDTTWFIIDATAPPAVSAFIVFISSPQRSRVHEFRKNSTVTMYMPVWSRDEIQRAHSLGFKRATQSAPNVTIEQAMESFDLFGGIPRYVFESGTRLEMWKNHLKWAIDKADLKKLEEVLGDRGSADCEGVGHMVLQVIYRSETDPEIPFFYKFEFCSPRVQLDFTRHVCLSKEKEVYKFLADVADIPEFATVYGYVFEGAYHSRLAQGGTFKTARLHKNAPPSDVEPITLEKSEFKRFDKLEALTVPNNKVYWVPNDKNFPGIDSLMFPDMLFQMTVASKHALKKVAIEDAAKTLRDLQKEASNQSQGVNDPISPCVIRLFFVVPEAKFGEYREQNLLDGSRRVTGAIDGDDLQVEQFVLAEPVIPGLLFGQ